MKVTPLRTAKIHPNQASIIELIDRTIHQLSERNIVVITSKVVSLCENQVVAKEGVDRNELIKAEAELYHVPNAHDPDLRYHFTIKQGTLIPASGIDSSNGNGDYILWPKNALQTAESVRHHLAKRFNLHEVGVVITDSTVSLSRWGTLGIAIGHSGFSAVKSYIGQPDLFGRTLKLSQANIAGGLAAAAVLAMGEGAEQTPIAIIEDVPFVDFHADADPSPYYISPLDDEPFQPFFGAVTWQRGGMWPPDLVH